MSRARARAEPAPAEAAGRVSADGTAEPAAADASPRDAMLIGEVAALTGLTQRTLRYYEDFGLLHPAPRLEGGFRLYSAADIQRLEHILELKRLLGFSLLEIKEMVDAEEERRELRQAYHREVDLDARQAQLARALEIARFQLAKLDAHLTGLQQLRDKVERRIQRYESRLREAEPADGAAPPGGPT